MWLSAINTSSQAKNQAQRQVTLADDNKVASSKSLKPKFRKVSDFTEAHDYHLLAIILDYLRGKVDQQFQKNRLV